MNPYRKDEGNATFGLGREELKRLWNSPPNQSKSYPSLGYGDRFLLSFMLCRLRGRALNQSSCGLEVEDRLSYQKHFQLTLEPTPKNHTSADEDGHALTKLIAFSSFWIVFGVVPIEGDGSTYEMLKWSPWSNRKKGAKWYYWINGRQQRIPHKMRNHHRHNLNNKPGPVSVLNKNSG